MQALFAQRLSQCKTSITDESKCIVFFDTETTGLDAQTKDQVVELGAVCVHTQNTFESLVAIDAARFPEYTGEFTGITPSMLTNAEPLSTVLTKFLQWLQVQAQTPDQKCTEVVLVAHNNHKFDMLLLERHFHECKIDVPALLRPRLVYFDSLPALRKSATSKPKSFTLGSLLPADLASNNKVVLHRALADCQALVIVLFDERFDVKKLWDHMQETRKLSAFWSIK